MGAEAAATGVGQFEGAFEPLLEVLLLDGADLAIARADGHTEMQEDGGGSKALPHGRGDVGLAPEQGVVVMGEVRGTDADVGLEADAERGEQGRDRRRIALGQLGGALRAEDLGQPGRRDELVAFVWYGFQQRADVLASSFSREPGR